MKQFGVIENSSQLREEAMKALKPLSKEAQEKLCINDVKSGGFINVEGIVHRVLEINSCVEEKVEVWREAKILSFVDGSITYLNWLETNPELIYLTTAKSSGIPSLEEAKRFEHEFLKAENLTIEFGKKEGDPILEIFLHRIINSQDVQILMSEG